MYPERLEKFSKLKKIVRKMKMDVPLFIAYIYVWERVFPNELMKNEKQYYLSNKNKIKKIIDRLGDEESVKTYIAVLNFRMSRRGNLFKIKRPDKEQYFSADIVKLIDEEYFVDCGAYIGDTLEMFLHYTSGGGGAYYALEPDSKNADTLEQYIKDNFLKNVEVLKYGVAEKSGKIRFSESATSGSAFDENGTVVLEVKALDDLLQNKKVTFIKMDIEGAETDALNGSWNIIEKNRPKLAICIYHKMEDMVNIPLMLMERLDNYSFYIRHYNCDQIETVFYCIPNEI